MIRVDLADPGAAWRLVVAAARARGGLDVLVNSAARFARTPFASTSLAQYDRLLDLNLRGAFFCSQAAGTSSTSVMPPRAGDIRGPSTRYPRYITGQILAVDGGEGAGA